MIIKCILLIIDPFESISFDNYIYMLGFQEYKIMFGVLFES